MEENHFKGPPSPTCIMPKTSFSDLPLEMVQSIFCLLDCKSIIMCKRVSKSWRDQVRYFEEKGTFWYDHCTKEIPCGPQFDLLDNIFPCHWENPNSVDWQIIYSAWYSWNAFQVDASSSSVESFMTGLDGISAVKVSGEWLLISTCEKRGKLIAKNFIKNTVLEVYTGSNDILNFELVKCDNNSCLSNVEPSGELEDFFNTLDHNEIWIELRESYIRLGKTYLHYLDKVRQKIRHSYGYEVRLVNEAHHSILHLTKTCKAVKGPDVAEMELCDKYTALLDVWFNKVTLVEGTLSTRVQTFTLDLKTMEVYDTLEMIMDSSPREAVKIHSWHGALYIAYSSNRSLVFKTKNQLFIVSTPLRRACITSAMYYSTYLFLGTDRGELFIYKVEDTQDLFKHAVYQNDHHPGLCGHIQVGNNQISHLAVSESIHHRGKKPIIICASPEEVYLVSFPKL